MTPAEEARFITLWNAGTATAAIAQQLGIPPGTARSRAYTLQQQGKIPRRPQGGRRVPALARAGGAPARAPAPPPPVQSSAEQDSAESPQTALVPSPTVASAAIIDLLRQTLARLDTVEQDLKAIREDHHPASAVQSSAGQSGAVQNSVDLPSLSPEEARAERWNLWLPRGLRRQVEAVAKARGHAPSKVVQEALWQWLAAAQEGR